MTSAQDQEIDRVLAELTAYEKDFEAAMEKLDSEELGDDGAAELAKVLSIGRLMQQIDQTNGALDVVDSKVNALISKIDTILTEAETSQDPTPDA